MTLFTDEIGPIYNRFSVIVLVMYLYYGMSYYFVLDTPMTKPHIGIFMIAMAVHILQVVLIKYLHENEHYPFIWLAIILPVVLFILFKKIMDNKRMKAEKRRALSEAMQNASQEDPIDLGFRNAKPQAPTRQSIPMTAQKPQHMNSHYDSANMNKNMVKGNRNMGNIVQDIEMQYDPNNTNSQRTMNQSNNSPDYSTRQSVNQLAPQGHTGMPQGDGGFGMIGGPSMVGGFDPYATNMSSF